MKPRTCLALAVAGWLLSVSCPAPVAQSAHATTPDVFAFVRALDDAAARQLTGRPNEVSIAPGRHPVLPPRNTEPTSAAITVPAGQHPLADGIRQLTIVGIEGTPKVGRDGETITLEAPGVRLMLRGVEAVVDGEAVRITVKKSSSG